MKTCLMDAKGLGIVGLLAKSQSSVADQRGDIQLNPSQTERKRIIINKRDKLVCKPVGPIGPIYRPTHTSFCRWCRTAPRD